VFGVEGKGNARLSLFWGVVAKVVAESSSYLALMSEFHGLLPLIIWLR
jgi:hypothetical protein